MSTLAINEEGLQSLRDEYKIVNDSELAERLQMNKGTVSRVLAGKSAPGPRFIASVLTSFPVKFEDVFDSITDEPVTASAPAREAVAA
jgi:transcriptional regulator with XRE-family HTH domain